MHSTDATPAGTPAAPAKPARTEQLFARDDTSGVDAFHQKTTWAPILDRALALRINAFLNAPAMWNMVSRSRHQFGAVESIALPHAGLGTITLQEALVRRRSLASDAAPRAGTIDVDDIAAILKYSYGIVGERRAADSSHVQRLRACPSAGGLYPLEIYPVVMDVAGLACGLYHYDAVHHALSCLRREDARVLMPGLDFQPHFRQQASVVFIVTAVLLRSMAKYLDRGYRFVMNEAGALTQNLHLTTLARGLPGCVLGGFCDADVAAYVGADGAKEIVVLGFIVGKRSPHTAATA